MLKTAHKLILSAAGLNLLSFCQILGSCNKNSLSNPAGASGQTKPGETDIDE